MVCAMVGRQMNFDHSAFAIYESPYAQGVSAVHFDLPDASPLNV